MGMDTFLQTIYLQHLAARLMADKYLFATFKAVTGESLQVQRGEPMSWLGLLAGMWVTFKKLHQRRSTGWLWHSHTKGPFQSILYFLHKTVGILRGNGVCAGFMTSPLPLWGNVNWPSLVRVTCEFSQLLCFKATMVMGNLEGTYIVLPHTSISSTFQALAH